MAKKDLGLMAMAYGNVYVARIAFGANRLQTIKAFTEADEYEGPSIIIAYATASTTVRPAQGHQPAEARRGFGRVDAVRYNPKLAAEGKNPLTATPRSPPLTSATTCTTR